MSGTADAIARDELRAAKQAAGDAKFTAFAALRTREREIAAQFVDPYGRDNRAYVAARAADSEAVRLSTAFSAARDAFHVAARAFREGTRVCPVCADAACETKSEACGK